MTGSGRGPAVHCGRSGDDGGTHRGATRPVSKYIFAALIAFGAGAARPDSTTVLPAGVSRVYIDFYHYLPTTRRFNADGDREPVTFPFDDATLDSDVFTSLQPLDAFVAGKATLGDVSVDYEYAIDVLDFGYSHGITDRLSVGFHVPYYRVRNDVDTAFDAGSANVGLDPVTGDCCIPLTAGGTPMDEQDVQDLVQSEFGFPAIEDWRREGAGDLEIGAKYRPFLRRDSALALTAGLRFPTGRDDDPDDLTDVAWSHGTRALLLRLHHDYLLSNLWTPQASVLGQAVRAPGDLVLNTTLRYDYMFPDEKMKRIGDTPDQIFTNNRERVSRDLGDILGLELSGQYQASRALSVETVYTWTFEERDRISGDRGFNYDSLEADTDSRHEVVAVMLRYSTLHAFSRDEAMLPLVLSAGYRERVSGDGPRSGQANPILETSWVVFGVRVLF